MTQRPLELPGLEGHNPLGFFAALGLLRILDQHARTHSMSRPLLAFSDTSPFAARLLFDGTLEALKEIVLADAKAQASSVALGLAYDDAGVLCDPGAKHAKRDLKPNPDSARACLTNAAAAGRRDADLAAGLISDVVQDNNGATKPTAFHFAAGQQEFLKMVEELRTGIDGAALDEALIGPWTNSSKLPSLAWDSSVARFYALRASDPSGEKRGSVPAANWLGVHALAFFPVMPEQGRERAVLRTTNVGLGWKNVPFTWPLWREPADVQSIASLLRLDPALQTQRERSAVGVTSAFRSRIQRTDQGGYGSFSPAEVVPPARRERR